MVSVRAGTELDLLLSLFAIKTDFGAAAPTSIVGADQPVGKYLFRSDLIHGGTALPFRTPYPSKESTSTHGFQEPKLFERQRFNFSLANAFVTIGGKPH